ncbi:hypothetical protein Q31a_49130 [Aureliella helgolandensis]|uniref:Uncharacterized protein n=1 Tax=Aureliella helgolandensis TaxID=2527968 RepID=A0A518GD71_9BACT|nr:hypothetical protein Q31a_49130 [Aureliella helgolandensis]
MGLPGRIVPPFTRFAIGLERSGQREICVSPVASHGTSAAFYASRPIPFQCTTFVQASDLQSNNARHPRPTDDIPTV